MPVIAHAALPGPEGWAAGVLLVAGAVYGWSALRLRRSGASLPGWRIVAFGAGLLLLGAALLSPLDALAHGLLSAHMLQHLLLVAAAAPLLVVGAPVAALVRSLPPRARRRLASAAAGPLRRLGGWGSPGWLAVAFGGHLVVLLAWHVPALYQGALAGSGLHTLEHATFLGTALLFWGAVAAAARRAAYGMGIALLFLTSMASGVLAALLMFSPRAWYPANASAAGSWGLTALEDQQIAAGLMWVPGGLVYAAAAILLFVTWLRAAAHRMELGGPARAAEA